MSLASFSVKNSVLVNMIVVIVFIAGIYVANTIPKEEMPAVDFGSFVIVVSYPGVSPEQIENLIIDKIEKEIYDVENIDYISSEASEGKAVIFVQMEPDADIDQAWNDVNTELDKVRDLPDDATDPIIIKLNMREINPICTISLSGDFSPLAMKEIAENLQDDILQIDYISKADVSGKSEREILIECDRNKLDAYGITLDEISGMIRSRNISFPAGTIKEGMSEFIATTTGEYKNAEEIAVTPVRTDANGDVIRLDRVASVKDTLKEMNVYSRLNGKSGVFIYVYKKADGNIIDVIQVVKEKIADYKTKVAGLDIALRNDGSIDVKRSLNALSNNAMIGIVLVFLTLWMFIGWRNALLAAFGIPFTFLFAFIMMDYFDITMNNLTLFALLLVLGMIVDDAIVVIENVHRYREMGFSRKEAAIKGTQTIMWPVISAVMTTVFAFVPMIIMQGMMGKFMRFFPIVVSIALLASLFEALVILPSHLAEFTGDNEEENNKPHKVLNCMINFYRKLLLIGLKHRIKTVSLVVILFFASFAVLFSGLIKMEFFPSGNPQTIVLRTQMPNGTDLDNTAVMTDKIENYIRTMKEKDDITNIVTTVGQMIKNHRLDQKTNYAELRIDLTDAEDMKFTNDEIKASISSFLENEPNIISYEFGSVQAGPPTGKDVELRIKGDSFNGLKKISEEIKTELSKIEGVSAISDDFTKGKSEFKIYPDPEKCAYHGITASAVASFLRTAVTGSEISELSVHNEKIKIRLKLRQDQSDEIEDIKKLYMRSPKGYIVALKDIVDFRIEPGVAQISHWNKKRAITVSAEMTFYEKDGNKVKRSPNEVNEILFGNKIKGTTGSVPRIMNKYQGYTLEAGGMAEEQRKSFTSLYLAFVIAVLLIFSVLAAQFHSYVQPLIVMLTIPFSFIGVIIGLLVTNLPFSLNSLIAIVALSGIVVNDSLILVDFVNTLRDKGVDRWNSLIEAGITRLRPIILTTVTTIFGLMPMILSTSSATKDWKPMAVSIVFGLSFATVLTLVVIPVVYSLIDSFFGKLKMTRFKEHIAFEDAVKSKDYCNKDQA
ncbi:MAG: efflux RND transporter permease subunit [Candidatus Delongbacteria bacterium]|nr:efflux RND transporter permease subunit [Candidatus Delongbacteria bacterium]